MVIDRGNRGATWFVAFALASWIGCNSSDSEPPSNDSNATSAAQASATQTTIERHVRPDETVTEFLTALKSGDQARATSMLTVVAQQEMAKSEAMIQPPGSSTATFEVTQTEILGDQKDGAHVLSTWSDAEANGQQTTHEIVWILRREPAGWAIAGFATRVFEDQPPLILNFEDPLDLQRKRDLVDAEITRRHAPQTVRHAEAASGTTQR